MFSPGKVTSPSHPSHVADRSKMFSLKPGKSVRVELPEQAIPGDGIYRYAVWALLGDDVKTARIVELGSNAFLIDRTQPRSK